MNQRLLFIFTIIFCNFSDISQARWATIDDAVTETELYNHFIKINEDGTYEEEIELQEKILKDAGREKAATYSLYYNGDSEELKLISAKTIFNGKEYKVPKQNIEDKPLASAGQGFDHIKQVYIAFPNAEVGAQIYFKYKQIVKKPNLENFFSFLYKFGSDDYWKNANLKIHSALPLNIIVNDPNQVLKIRQDAKENIHDLEVSLVKPIYTDTVNEPSTSVTNLKLETWVSISSLVDWKTLALMLSKDYQKVIDQPLPDMFEEIVASAITGADEMDQINIVTSQLNEKVQYLGDWRSVDGRFRPRDLAKIASTQIGDCKDYSVSTAAILKKLGYNPQVAIVNRGELNQSPLEILPHMSAFNHAMLKVTNKDNKVYWIDPTNFASMAGNIFPDIENKMALILDVKNPGYEKIPAIDPKQSLIESSREIEIKGNLIDEYCEVNLKGSSALSLTGAFLNASKKLIEDAVFKILSGTNIEDNNRKSIILPDLSSRIVKDLNFKVHYEQKNLTFKTNLGSAYPLNSDWADVFIGISYDHVGDIYIGSPFIKKWRAVFKNVTANNLESLNYNIISPWVVASRQCNYAKNGVEVIESIETLMSFIPVEDLKTEAYMKLQEELKQNVKDAAIVFSDK